MDESADRELNLRTCKRAMVEQSVETPAEALALAVVLRAYSQLGEGPSVTLHSWPIGDSVVIVARYRCLQSDRPRSVTAARRRHAELRRPIEAAIAEIADGRLELRGASFSGQRCLSAFAFSVRYLPASSLVATQPASPSRYSA